MFSVKDNLARIDYARYELNEQTETAMKKCPTKVITYRGKMVESPEQPAAAATGS